ncbi:CBS domain-containing protein [Kitasatospora sp. NPDC007106]|uniref:CBS domain-containing protein n=1 Tax=Kitasatospora sp. NPDC007106 TaxID=3156914 RepID=UPI0033DCA21B
MTGTPESPATPTVGDLMSPPALQIGDDVTVDTALDILQSSGADHLLVHDEDGRCTGLLTRLHLAPFQARSWYTERTPVRDVPLDRAPFATADMPAATAAATMRSRELDMWPVVDHDGHTVGLLTLPDGVRHAWVHGHGTGRPATA